MLMSGVQTAVSQSTAPSWLPDAVFYQIFPERFANGDSSNDPPRVTAWGRAPTARNHFGGDLQGIIDHLGYISALGANAIYLNPIFTARSNHKYDTEDYLQVDPHFGTEATFKALVDSCHARGIRVILDGVFNHTGVDFFAFADVKKNGAKSKYAAWYDFKSFPVGPPDKPNYEAWWGIGSLPKLMTRNPEVREYLFKVTRHWMNLGIDGWRLDVPNEIPHEFWIEWRRLVKSLNPEAYITGEIWDDAAAWLQGDQFDGVMNYRFYKACVGFFAKDSLTVSEFDGLLARQRADYPAGANFALQNLLGSHDTERFLTLCGGDKKLWKLALFFQMTSPGAPMIYYGDEVGMTGGKDPACRGTMVWEASKQDTDMLGFTRSLVALRNSVPALRRAAVSTFLVDDSRKMYGCIRREGSSAAAVAINKGTRAAEMTLPPASPGTVWVQVWPVEPDGPKNIRSAVSRKLPALSGCVFVEKELP